jgi:hypothetical protein
MPILEFDLDLADGDENASNAPDHRGVQMIDPDPTCCRYSDRYAFGSFDQDQLPRT